MRTRFQDGTTPEPRETAVQPFSDLQALRHQQQESKLIPDAVLVEIMLECQLEKNKRRSERVSLLRPIDAPHDHARNRGAIG
jgi:hypothetical protein